MVNHRRKQHEPEWTGKDHEILRPDVSQLSEFTGFETYIDRLSHSMIQGYH